MGLITNLTWKKLAFVLILICPMIFALIAFPFVYEDALQPVISILSGILGFTMREMFERDPPIEEVKKYGR